MELASLPPATARLAVELQLADINYIMQDLDAGDAYSAFDAMQASLKSALLLLQDQTRAMEILQADHNDRVVLHNLIQEERQAERDHRIACGMCNVTDGGTERSAPGSGECFEGQGPWLGDDFQDPDARLGDARADDPLVSIVADTGATYRGHGVQRIQKVAGDPAFSYAESSARSMGKGKGRVKEGVFEDEHVTHTFCSACMEQYTHFDVLELGCKREEENTCHAYCRGCLIDLFETSLTDTTLFPPRCCGKYIPVSACFDLLSSELVRRYNDKQVELASPNPVYCSNRFCVKFIEPDSVIAGIAVCQICNTETCAVCKNPKHNGLCPKDPTVQLLMNVAGEERWQRCPRCRTMVELLTGCYHMRCWCTAEFCYLCAKPWKTCSCPHSHVNRLLADDQMADEPENHIAMPEQEEIVELDPALDVLNDIQLRVATVAGGFAVANAEEEASDDDVQSLDLCKHLWQRSHGINGELEVCGICHHHLRFVNSCKTCRTRVCNRCLNNRL
ncbi:hypothetical protein PMIN03_002248 [Paraphaeosphaeria minitans]